MLEELEYLASVLLAVVLGFAIGYERKLRYKEAGIRTHTIVCAGSALIMVVSKYGFGDSVDADASRVAAQIVSGIGFLGSTGSRLPRAYGQRRASAWRRARRCICSRRAQRSS